MIQMVTAVSGNASSTYRVRLTCEPELISVTFIPKTASDDIGRMDEVQCDRNYCGKGCRKKSIIVRLHQFEQADTRISGRSWTH